MDEIDFNSVSETKVDDITTLGVAPETLDVLNSLGVMTSDAYNSQLPKKEEDIQKENDDILQEMEKVESTISIDTNIDEPNLILPKSEIVRALRYAGVMIKKVTNDIEASSLNITYSSDGKVLYRLKDNMTWITIEGNCNISNNKPITKTLSFNVSYLTRLLSAAASDVLIYSGKAIDQKKEEKDVYYIRIINGDYILDVIEGDESKLIPSGNKTDLLSTLSSKAVSTMCDVMIPLINDTQEIASKRTILYNDRSIFKSVTYLLQYRNIFNQMCLGKKELDILKLVSLNNEDIQVYATNSNGENRIIFTNQIITVSTSVSIPNRDEMLINRLSIIENAKYMKINKDDFKRVLFLSGLGTNNVGRLYLNYNLDGDGIDAKIEGRTGNSTLTISGDNYNRLEPKNEPVEIYAPQLSVLLKSFEGGKDLEIAFLQEGVAFRDSVLGIEAIMNYAR